MQVISFKDTILYKRGFWFSAVALVAAVAAPSIVDGSLLSHPVVHMVPIFILTAFWVYFLQTGRFFSIADEVVDGGLFLKVRRGRAEVIIPLSAITSVEVTSEYRMHRITIHLREPTQFGKRIDFWPQASLWGNLYRIQRVVTDLADRAKKAARDNV